MKHYLKTLVVMTACGTSIVLAEEKSWFFRPNIGVSSLSDLTVDVLDLGGVSGPAGVELDSGVVAGFGIGYQYNSQLAAELAWEYRSNDSVVSLPDGKSFEDGNYASNTFFLNGIYSFDSTGALTPYLGAGVAWIQEIDIDLESPDEALSYTADGDVGFQVFGGVDYDLGERLTLQAELRYTRVSGLDLDPEVGASGRFVGFHYEPVTLQLGLKYRF